MRAYRDNDMLVITNDANYEARFPFPAIGALELQHYAHASQVSLRCGDPKPWTFGTTERVEAHSLTQQINECIARWLYDHFPTVRREDP